MASEVVLVVGAVMVLVVGAVLLVARDMVPRLQGGDTQGPRPAVQEAGAVAGAVAPIRSANVGLQDKCRPGRR